jgi:choline-sulfatase
LNRDRAPNFLFLSSDQHSKFEVGCYGNEVIRTPNIDRLAAEGTRFTAAYTNNPICVPARASMATGEYGYKIGCIDNATPYTGQIPSFGHRLVEAGIPVTTIGKLHYRNVADDTGFPDQRIPLHIRDGIGDIYGLLRGDPRINKGQVGEFPTKAKVGTSSYLEYDARITEEALGYLEERKNGNGPWCCFVSYSLPHFPLVATQETYDMYDETDIPMPFARKPGEWSMHESCRFNRKFYRYEEGYSDEIIRHARHVYYAMCTYMDMQIGRVLDKLREIGEYQNTVILYTSDHGENCGNHGMWNKNNMLEASAGIPMTLSGPGLPKDKVCDTPVSLVDIYPTIIEAVGLELDERERRLPGESLLEIAKAPDRADRAVFAEYHATGSETGGFMLRRGDYKYIYYVGYPPQLFNVVEDPHELHDLIDDPSYADVIKEMDARLRTVAEPEEVDARAKELQESILEAHGGREKVFSESKPVVYSPAPTEGGN